MVVLAEEQTMPLGELFVHEDACESASELLELLRDHREPAQRWNDEVEVARDSRLNFDRDTGDGQAPAGLLDPRGAGVGHRLMADDLAGRPPAPGGQCEGRPAPQDS